MCIDPLFAYFSYDKRKIVYMVKLALTSKDELLFHLKSKNLDLKYGKWYIIPCRKCVGCQLDRSIEWKNRMILESKYYNKDSMCFITLTYNDDNLVKNKIGIPILFKSHVQNFLKSLRKYFNNNKIRYFICGEYGSQTKRPHYHCIFYGLGIKDFKDLEFEKIENDFIYYHSLILEKHIWKKGKCIITQIDDKCIGYVSSYCVKKINKEINYDYIDIVKPFILTSRGNSLYDNKGSIGSRYILDNKEEIIKNDLKYYVHYDNKTYVGKVPMSQRYLLTDKKSSKFKSFDYNNLKSDELIHFDVNSYNCYVDFLNNSPFVHSSKYFNNRAQSLLDKIKIIKGGI